MKIIPISEFENEYAITDQGTVIDLSDNSTKVSYIIKYFAINQPVVDLYKNGEFIFTVTIRELVLKHFFGLSLNHKIHFLNGDNNDYSPYNLELSLHNTEKRYVNRHKISKPAPIYRYSDNGPYAINQDEIDEYDNIKNKLAEVYRQESKEKRKLAERKTPLPGTPEREEWAKERKLISKLNKKLKYIQECSQKMNIPFNLTAKDVIDLHQSQNGICVGTEEIIDLNKVFTIMPKVPEYGYVRNNVDLLKTRRKFGIYKPRKVKPLEDIKTKQIVFRITENEFSAIKDKAKESDLTVSEYILSKIF